METKLTTKDLMIGDWVTVRRPNNRHEQVKVKSIIGNGTIEAKTSDGLVTIGESAIIPIPLTPEILEKNGFRFDDTDTGLGEQGSEMMTVVKNSGLDALIYMDNGHVVCSVYAEDGVYDKVLFVHTLQHAMRLCGVDKEIEL